MVRIEITRPTKQAVMQSNPGVAFAEGVACSLAGVADKGDCDTGGAVVAVVTLSTVAESRDAVGEGSVSVAIEGLGDWAPPEEEGGCRVVGMALGVAVSDGAVPTCTGICRRSIVYRPP
jgi:hypothetical protein